MFARTDTAGAPARPLRRITPPVTGWPRPQDEAFAERLSTLLLHLEEAPAMGFSVRPFADIEVGGQGEAEALVGLRLPTGVWTLTLDQTEVLTRVLRDDRPFQGAEAVAAAIEDAAAEANELAMTLNMDVTDVIAGRARVARSRGPKQPPPAHAPDQDDAPSRAARWILFFLVVAAFGALFLLACVDAGAANGAGAG